MKRILALCLLAVACHTADEPGLAGTTVREPAILRIGPDSTTVTILPSSPRVNSPITVSFNTFGGGCISTGETEVSVTGLQADIRPYQYRYYPRANEGCTTELRFDPHTVTLQFATVGMAQVRIQGQTQAQPANQPYTVVRNVTIAP